MQTHVALLLVRQLRVVRVDKLGGACDELALRDSAVCLSGARYVLSRRLAEEACKRPLPGAPCRDELLQASASSAMLGKDPPVRLALEQLSALQRSMSRCHPEGGGMGAGLWDIRAGLG